jgi:hypothetical protein
MYLPTVSVRASIYVCQSKDRLERNLPTLAEGCLVFDSVVMVFDSVVMARLHFVR